MYFPALLDTDILSELFKGHNLVKEKVSGYLNEHKQLTISHITRYEILNCEILLSKMTNTALATKSIN